MKLKELLMRCDGTACSLRRYSKRVTSRQVMSAGYIAVRTSKKPLINNLNRVEAIRTPSLLNGVDV